MSVLKTTKSCLKNWRTLRILIYPVSVRRFSVENSKCTEEEEETISGNSLDTFIGNVQKNLKITKKSSTILLCPQDSVTNQPSVSCDVERYISKTEKRTIKNIDSNFCYFAEETLKELIVNRKIQEILQKLNYLKDVERFPSRTMLRTLAMFFTSEKHLEGLQKVQELCRYSYPKEFEWVVGYQHYEAELLWRTGKWRESLALFRDIYCEYPHMQRKVTNLLSFRMNDACNEGSLEMCEALVSLVEAWIKLGDYYPTSNLWRSCFLSENIHVQMIAEKLIEKYPILSEYIPKKFGTIINRAFATYNIDILQRLVQCVLTLELSSYYGRVLGALLDFQCKIGNLEEAKRTFKYAAEFKILLPATSIEKFRNLLHEPNLRIFRKYPKPFTDKIPPSRTTYLKF